MVHEVFLREPKRETTGTEKIIENLARKTLMREPHQYRTPVAAEPKLSTAGLSRDIENENQSSQVRNKNRGRRTDEELQNR
jgi:hypothetical protein